MQNARAQGYLQKIEEEAATGVPCQSRSLLGTWPYKAIIEAAEKNGCDLIFMASHGRSGLLFSLAVGKWQLGRARAAGRLPPRGGLR